MSLSKTLLRWNWKFHVPVLVGVVIAAWLIINFGSEQARHNYSIKPISSVSEAEHLSYVYIDFLEARPVALEKDVYESALIERVWHSKTPVEAIYKMIYILKLPNLTPLQKRHKPKPSLFMQEANLFSDYLGAVCEILLGDEYDQRLSKGDYRCTYGE